MPRRTYDPLYAIPPPDAVRARLADPETLAARLRILLELAEQLRLPVTTADRLSHVTTGSNATLGSTGQGVARG